MHFKCCFGETWNTKIQYNLTCQGTEAWSCQCEVKIFWPANTFECTCEYDRMNFNIFTRLKMQILTHKLRWQCTYFEPWHKYNTCIFSNTKLMPLCLHWACSCLLIQSTSGNSLTLISHLPISQLLFWDTHVCCDPALAHSDSFSHPVDHNYDYHLVFKFMAHRHGQNLTIQTIFKS